MRWQERLQQIKGRACHSEAQRRPYLLQNDAV